MGVDESETGLGYPAVDYIVGRVECPKDLGVDCLRPEGSLSVGKDRLVDGCL